jgi:hypothetical protein
MQSISDWAKKATRSHKISMAASKAIERGVRKGIVVNPDNPNYNIFSTDAEKEAWRQKRLAGRFKT